MEKTVLVTGAKSNPLIVLNNLIYEGALADIYPADIASVDHSQRCERCGRLWCPICERCNRNLTKKEQRVSLLSILPPIQRWPFQRTAPRSWTQVNIICKDIEWIKHK